MSDLKMTFYIEYFSHQQQRNMDDQQCTSTELHKDNTSIPGLYPADTEYLLLQSKWNDSVVKTKTVAGVGTCFITTSLLGDAP